MNNSSDLEGVREGVVAMECYDSLLSKREVLRTHPSHEKEKLIRDRKLWAAPRESKEELMKQGGRRETKRRRWVTCRLNLKKTRLVPLHLQ